MSPSPEPHAPARRGAEVVLAIGARARLRPWWSLRVAGAAGSLLGVVFGAWWWAPVPLLAAAVAEAVIGWWAAPVAPSVALTPDGVRIHSGLGHAHLLRADDIVGLTTLHDDRRTPGRTVLSAATSRGETVVAEIVGGPPPAGALPATSLDAALGTVGGLARTLGADDQVALALTPLAHDAAVALDAALRKAAGPRAAPAARAWSGAEPPLDATGQHAGPSDGVLITSDDGVLLLPRAVGADVATPRRLGVPRSVGHALRSAPLLIRLGERGGVADLAIPLLVVGFDDATVVVPSLHAPDHGPDVPLDDRTLHAHVADGGAVLLSWVRRWPDLPWPPPLRAAVAREV